MKSILDEIVLSKRREVAEAAAGRPLEALEERLPDAPAIRPFATELAADPGDRKANVIAEIKRRSPSAGLIRDDFDPVDIAGRYHAGGARAISCLTDEPYFGGRLEHLVLVRGAVPLPVLRKDFIIDRYQVAEARVAGADAVLLIAECLDDRSLLECHEYARSLGLSVLVEVHSPENLERVLGLVTIDSGQGTLLGINNRDLTRMQTDPGRTGRLLATVADGVVRPGDVVSESGIRTPDDLRALRGIGVHSVLVGEHLMGRPDPGRALAELLS
ncbi:MAG: indole-3-glycerol phosphate synthase TrpC [Planctomycetota bacterium]|nr:indole-3-glycerol phosphate synthase TrpC [Planctomycetota bacterium]